MDKKTIENFINPEIEQYADEHTTAENKMMADFNRWVHVKMSRPRMLSGAYQGKLLEMISCMVRPMAVLEIGAYVGYSAICLAKGLQDGGMVHTIEVDEELEDIILEHVDKAGLSSKIKLHIGNALEVLPSLQETFDLVFIDADKINYAHYYNMVLPYVRKGGYILLDNILWSGKVLYPQPKGDKETAVLKELNDFIQADDRVENILLPIRDGLMVCRKL